MKCIAKKKGFFGGQLIKPGGLFLADVCPGWAAEVQENESGASTTISIRDALLQLRRDDDAHWNKNNSPKLSVLSDICGYKVAKDDVAETWPGFSRSMLQHGQKMSDGSVIGAE